MIVALANLKTAVSVKVYLGILREKLSKVIYAVHSK